MSLHFPNRAFPLLQIFSEHCPCLLENLFIPPQTSTLLVHEYKFQNHFYGGWHEQIAHCGKEN